MKIEINADTYTTIEEDLEITTAVYLESPGSQSDAPIIEETHRLEDLLYNWFEANVVPTDPPYLHKEERKRAKQMVKNLNLLTKKVEATIKVYARKNK